MKLLRKIAAYFRVMGRARRNHGDLIRFLVRRPALLIAVATYETGTLLSARFDSKLKFLAQIKAAAMVGCPF